MADGLQVKVTGIPDLREALSSLVPKLRVRALRNALAAGARVVQGAARAATPVLSPASLAVRTLEVLVELITDEGAANVSLQIDAAGARAFFS